MAADLPENGRSAAIFVTGDSERFVGVEPDRCYRRVR